jgi:mono/diheme cytochrome c family protein
VNPAPTYWRRRRARDAASNDTVALSLRSFFPWAVLSLGIACLGIVGCGDVDPPYSNLVKYGLRADPLVISDKLGEERYDPDRPGQLPLIAVKEFLDPVHPLYPKREVWHESKQEKLLRDPAELPAEDMSVLEAKLEELFGTPRAPTVGGISDEERSDLKLDDDTLARGSVLYRIHCLHCHGVPGDGRGPTARWVNPHPRDFRQGLFKFASVDQTASQQVLPPRREDLHRTLHQGIDNSAMPSFALLPHDDLERLVSYVVHLSIRGKTEFDTLKNAFEYDPDANTWGASRDVGEYAEAIAKIEGQRWRAAQQPDKKIKIAAYPYPEGDTDALRKSVARGQVLFLGQGSEEAKAANCVSCHKDYGRQATFRFDSWGTLVRPNNLTNGMYRGGRRTVDIYYRIHSGINGSGMASFGKVLKSESVWDLVNFVQALPYPAMRRDLGINID